MSVLRDRIVAQPGNMSEHARQHLTPVRAQTAVPEGHPVPPMVMTMPLSIVEVTADGAQVREALPLYAGPRGAPIPATGPGHWVQLRAAGIP